MIIQHSHWSRAHLVESVKFLAKAGTGTGMDFHEYGTYRGESLQLIENLFYAYQIPVRKGFGFDSFQGLPEEEPGVPHSPHFARGALGDVTFLWPTRQSTYIKGWFNNLSGEDISRHDMRPVCLVHIDSDLYVSARQALDFLFGHHLVGPGSVVAYDEFKSTPSILEGGESRAHREIARKHRVRFREFFRNIYHDRLDTTDQPMEWWQNAFVIEEIGEEAHDGICQEKNDGSGAVCG